MALNAFINFRISMYLRLIPIKLRLSVLIQVEFTVTIIFKTLTYKKVLLKRDLWAYEAPTISAKIVDTRKKENDYTPPEIKEFVDDPSKVIISSYLRSASITIG